MTSQSAEKCPECGAGPKDSCGRSFMPGRCPVGKRMSDEHLLELARASAIDLRRTSRPTAAQTVELLADEFERQKADLDLLARSGCRVREHNGRRFVEIVSDVQP